MLVNLSLMTPAHVARKRFAGEFDLDAHLADRRAKLSRRLVRAETVAAAVPSSAHRASHYASRSA
jgi:hypothetical protein